MGMERLVGNAKALTSESDYLAPDTKVAVVGCGGAGCNSVDRLQRIGVWGAHTIAVNTDQLHLSQIRSDVKILIGKRVTRGCGAGGRPEIGEYCAEEASEEIEQALKGADITFITTGLGGGTGTGSAPVVAKIAKELGSVVVSMGAMPFTAEGAMRRQRAIAGLEKLKRHSDSTIVLANDRLLKIVPKLPVDEAFSVMDQLVSEVIKSIGEAITKPSMINLDYADLKAVICNSDASTILYGENSSHEPERVVAEALSNPLLDVDYRGAKNALVHITAGPELNLRTTTKLVEGMTHFMAPDANVIFGARIDDDYAGQIKIVTILNGVKVNEDIFWCEQDTGAPGSHSNLSMVR
jgi:cell division protein FtsZ